MTASFATDKEAKIYVAGHNGLVGRAIVRALRAQGYNNLLLVDHRDLDLTDQRAVNDFFEAQKPDYVFLAAAKVGGIWANANYPAEFIRENLLIETNVIDAAWKNDCKKLAFLGSGCIYPKFAPQPIKEEYLLEGALEPTNDAYAIAKIAGIKMCQAYRSQYGFDCISMMPVNLYGPWDNFHPENSHVIPGLIRRMHAAKLADAPCVSVWGTGTPKRELMHVDDMADACLFLMRNYSEPQPINVGSGAEYTIREIAEFVKDAVGFEGEIKLDADKPDGTPRKLLDSDRLHDMGWKPDIPFVQGLEQTYEWYKAHYGA